jgi:hypothetical protein
MFHYFSEPIPCASVRSGMGGFERKRRNRAGAGNLYPFSYIKGNQPENHIPNLF